MKPLPIPELGTQVLIITDSNATFLNWLHTALSLIPRVGEKYFVLHHCCPAIYWEHGGSPSQEARQESRTVWKTEEYMLSRAEYYFDLVSTLLQELGVPADHIRSHLAVDEDDPLQSMLAELERGRYSGVIVSSYHHDLVRRLRSRGLSNLFRPTPRVEVWTLDEGITSVPRSA